MPSAPEKGTTRIVRTCCPVHNCGGRCLLVAHVKDGVITRLESDDRAYDGIDQPRLLACARGKAYLRRQYHIVLINAQRCLGCCYCEWACPYGAPQFDAVRGVMTKCNFCYDDLDRGEKPACVSACQMRVLEFGDMDDLRRKHGTLDGLFPLPEPALTRPAATFSRHRDTVGVDDPATQIGNQEEI